jgi:hypothetical protein
MCICVIFLGVVGCNRCVFAGGVFGACVWVFWGVLVGVLGCVVFWKWLCLWVIWGVLVGVFGVCWCVFWGVLWMLGCVGGCFGVCLWVGVLGCVGGCFGVCSGVSAVLVSVLCYCFGIWGSGFLGPCASSSGRPKTRQAS